MPKRGKPNARNRQTRVRRNHRVTIPASVEPAHFFPLPVPGLVAWYDFSDYKSLFTDTARTTPVTADADPIGGVTDKSPSGFHLSSLTTARPLYKANIVNGRSVARGDGADDYLSYELGAVGFVTVFCVSVNSTGGDASGRHWATSGNSTVFDNTNTYGYFGDQASGVVALTTANTSFAISAVTYNSTSSATAHINGTLRGTFDPHDGYSTATRIVLLASDSSGTANLKGDIAEFVAFNVPLSDTNRLSVERYLGSKWGVTVA